MIIDYSSPAGDTCTCIEDLRKMNCSGTFPEYMSNKCPVHYHRDEYSWCKPTWWRWTTTKPVEVS